MRIPRSAAAWAAAMGSGRSLFSPSLIRTIAASSWLPGGTGVGTAVGGADRFE
jgi:hypothetical protein